MKVFILIVLTLVLCSCNGTEYRNFDTRAGFEVVNGKIIPNLSADFTKNIEIMEEK